MVKYETGATVISMNGSKLKSVLEANFENGLRIYVFPGSLSPNDIIVKFKDANLPRTQIRQPKHIHWAVDLLIKKDNNPELTNKFLNEMLIRWKEIKPLSERSYDSIVNELRISKNQSFIEQFKDLDKHGFFSMNFIIHLMEILMIQEKTNNPNAYMFNNVVLSLLQSQDLYNIISKATHTGRK